MGNNLLCNKTYKDQLACPGKEVDGGEREKITTIDVTWDELANYASRDCLSPYLEYLRDLWVGDHPDRASGPRIGACHIYLAEDNFLHLDFETRFNFDANQKEILHLIKQEITRIFDEHNATHEIGSPRPSLADVYQNIKKEKR